MTGTGKSFVRFRVELAFSMGTDGGDSKQTRAMSHDEKTTITIARVNAIGQVLRGRTGVDNSSVPSGRAAATRRRTAAAGRRASGGKHRA